MSPLASCEVGVGVGAHNAEVVDGSALIHGVVGEGGDAHDVVGEGDGVGVHVVGEDDDVHGVVGEGDGVGVHAVGEDDGGGVHGVVVEGDGGGVHGVVEGDGGGVHGIGVVGDVVVHTVEVDGRIVEEGVCTVHVQNAAQEGNKVQAGNDHWVKSRHLGHCGIAMQDKENMFLSKPVGSMVMIQP